MGLVHNHSETLVAQVGDLVHNDRELLQGRHDDRLARLQSFPELTRCRIDVLDEAGRLLELTDRTLKLTVQNLAVGNHDDRVNDSSVGGAVEQSQLMCKPCDRVALAASSAVLDQVMLSSTMLAGVPQEAAHGVELVVSGEDKRSGTG